MRSLPLRRKTTCEKHDLVQSGKSSVMSWADVKLIPQTNKMGQLADLVSHKFIQQQQQQQKGETMGKIHVYLKLYHLAAIPLVLTHTRESSTPWRFQGGALPLRKNRLPLSLACRKRQLNWGHPVAVQGGGS